MDGGVAVGAGVIGAGLGFGAAFLATGFGAGAAFFLGAAFLTAFFAFAATFLFAFTGRVFFFVKKRSRYTHFVWHLCVLFGTTCHFLAVFACVSA